MGFFCQHIANTDQTWTAHALMDAIRLHFLPGHAACNTSNERDLLSLVVLVGLVWVAFMILTLINSL